MKSAVTSVRLLFFLQKVTNHWVSFNIKGVSRCNPFSVSIRMILENLHTLTIFKEKEIELSISPR